jgi:hypothetical protein
MFVQHRIGDSAAVANGWELDRLVIPWAKDDAASG